MTLDRAGAVAAFEDAYVERARHELGGRLAGVEAAILDRRPLAGHKVALAGWWCPEDASPDLVVLPNPWDDRTAIADHEAYCWALSERILAWLAQGLNEHHGIERGSVYWDVLLRSWLAYVLSASLDRRLYCLALARLCPELPVAAGPPLPVPATMVDAVRVLRTDLGNRALGSELARPLGLRLEALEQQAPSARASPPLRSPFLGRVLIAFELAIDLAVRTTTSTRRGRSVALVRSPGMSPIDTLRLYRRVHGLRMLPGPRQATVPAGASGDGGARGRLSDLAEADEKTAALVAAACRLLPRTVIEDYAALVARSARAYGRPCALVAGNYGPNDAENEFLARCADAEQPLAFAQHGGTYLQARVHAAERLERRSGSLFLSWGGTGKGVRPLPSPYLARLRDRHRGGDRVVIIEWAVPPDSYVFHFSTTPLGNQAYHHSALVPEFVRSIEAVQDRLFLKRFPAFLEGAERDPALAALPHRPPAARRTAVRLMAVARLAVITYPDTPLIEAMVLGVPTVGLWETDRWELRDDAQAQFDHLRDAGVIFSDPGAAAAQVDRVYDRADEWWGSAEVQAARRAFLDRFAASGDWLAQWSAFLRELSGGRATGP